ncbi:hypothetical protein D3C81_10810 [compost metagenome]
MQKKKFFAGLLMVAMVFSNITVFADETTVQPPESTKVETTAETQEVKTPDVKVVEKSGLHLNVTYPINQKELNYIPEFSMQLRDTSNKVLATAIANSSNFNKSTNSYALVFNVPEYTSGSEFRLVMDKGDSSVKAINFSTFTPSKDSDDIVRTDYSINTKTYASIVISSSEFTDADAKKSTVLDGSVKTPFIAQVQTDTSKVGVILENATGSRIKNETVVITNMKTKEAKEVKSDSYGIAWVDYNFVAPQFFVEMKNTNLAISNGTEGVLFCTFPFLAKGEALSNALFYKGIIDNNANMIPVSDVGVNITTSDNTDLSTKWTEVTLTLTKDDIAQTISVSKDSNKLTTLADGEYKVDLVESLYADAKLKTRTLKVVDGKGTIDISMTSKAIMDVSKAGEAYRFSVINVDSVKDKEYSGTKSTLFAVTPGESYLIKDNETGEVMTISVPLDAKLIRVVLGDGVTYDNVGGRPHTGDSLPIFLSIFGIAMIGAFFMFKKHGKDIKVSKNSFLSLFLVGTVAASSFVYTIKDTTKDITVEAGAESGGVQAKIDGGTMAANQEIVMEDGLDPGINNIMKGVLRVWFDITDGLTEDATLEDMAGESKFTGRVSESIYIPESARANDMWMHSGYITVDNSGGIYKMFGTTLFERNSKPVNVGDRSRATQQRNSGSGNKLISTVSRAMDNMGGSLAGGNIGAALDGVIKGEMYGDSAEAQKNRDELFNAYLDLLPSGGQGDALNKDILKKYYKENKVTLMAEPLMAIRVSGVSTSDYSKYNFISPHDTTILNSYLYNIGSTSEEMTNYNRTLSMGYQRNAKTDTYQNFHYATRTYVRHFLSAIYPISNKVQGQSVYGGWGFWHWDGTAALTATPKITADLNVTVVNENGAPTGTSFTQPVSGWTDGDNRFLVDITSSYNSIASIISGGMQISYNGKNYAIEPSYNNTVELLDVKDKENINKTTMKVGVGGSNSAIATPYPSSPMEWKYWIGVHSYPDAKALNTYLGGRQDNGSTLGSSDMDDYYNYINGGSGSTVDNKYKDRKNGDGSPASSDAKAIIHVKVKEVKTDGSQIVKEVPEWRLSKYWDKLSDKPEQQYDATFSMTLSADDNVKALRGNERDATTNKTASQNRSEMIKNSLKPSGSVQFSAVDPDLNGAPWAKSKAKFVGSSAMNITHESTNGSLKVTGDLLATKINDGISNIKLANWTKYSASINGIGSTNNGSNTNDSSLVERAFKFAYSIKSPNFSHAIYKYKEQWTANRYGVYNVYNDRSYTVNESPAQRIEKAIYDLKVRFFNYVAKGTSAPRFTGTSSSNGNSYTSVVASSEALKVNPEVAMAYDDASGRTSVAYVAGSKMRDIYPMSYNSAVMNMRVNSTVNGTTTATDTDAQRLANNLGAGGVGVNYKGSPVSAQFEITGNVVVKTFALDVNSMAKSAWNAGSSYNTDNIRDSFLSTFASKTSGGWTANMFSSAGLKINGNNYGDHNENFAVNSNGQSVTTHTLVLKGGKIVSVDGGQPSGELRTALENMKVLGDSNVFGAFERGAGANLTADDANVASLINAVRGTNDLGVNRPWYYEDTTTLVVKEYTTTFPLPEGMMFGDKIPMTVPGLDTPVDKQQFFNKGYTGHTTLKLTMGPLNVSYDSSNGTNGERKVNFVVPNVSILDTTN